METMEKPIKIAITGPESTGKTFLVNHLANKYNGLIVKESARDYLIDHHNKYLVTDIYKIGKLQMKQEEAVCRNAIHKQFVFIDTELINIKIWLEYGEYKVQEWILEGIKNADYDFYFLMYPDISWQADPLREHPDKGLFFFEQFKKNLEEQNKVYYIIYGSYEERQENAVNIINKLYF